MQDQPAPRVEITGVNATDLPTAVVTVNVLDSLGQPVRGLDESNFRLTGALADEATITSVENVSDDDLSFAVVLVIDISDSMTGLPITRAKEAAQLFVQSIGPNDPVAIYTFASRFHLVQDYTTDKGALSAAIDSLGTAGRTGLYEGAYNAVQLAAASPTSRRAMVLLSDGAEYGGVSHVGRDAALEEARNRGVPVYTVGLGYGIDRSYLEQLSNGTNGRFIESPDPEQLTQIYGDLAALLRSQYVVTINADLPLNGQEYDFRH
jgi:VWFA-related protein